MDGQLLAWGKAKGVMDTPRRASGPDDSAWPHDDTTTSGPPATERAIFRDESIYRRPARHTSPEANPFISISPEQPEERLSSALLRNSSEPSRPRHAVAEEPPADRAQDWAHRRHPFSRALLATVASTIIPGSGLLGVRSRFARLIGGLASFAFLGAIGFLAIQLVLDWRRVAAVAVVPATMRFASFALIGGALIWVALIVGTHLLRRPAKLTGLQRTVGGFAVFTLSALVSAPLAVAARYAHDQVSLLDAIFDGRSETAPDLEGAPSEIWKQKPRLNVLLIGADTDANRLNRDKDRPILTDTIMVASIDTHTGEVTMIQIPRNMARTPFPKDSKLAKLYPNGFFDGYSGDNLEYMVNAIYSSVPRNHPEVFANSDYPGADALKLGVGEAIGLKLDYFVLINIDGLERLIDAMGGVTVNINQRLPMGGSVHNPGATWGWLEPGPNQRLNGLHAMWYARSRWNTDDFNRMSRQSCLINAIVKQADPVTMLTRYEAIAQAGSQMVNTDIPQNVLPAITELALRVKTKDMKRIIFQHGVEGYNTANPNFDLMRQRVKEVLDPSSAPTPTAKPSPTQPSSKPGTDPNAPTSSPSATPPHTVDPNVSDACGYHPSSR